MNNSGVTARQQKVASMINAAVAEILRRGRGLDEKLINCPVTITKVNVTADLKIAHCYFVPFNSPLTVEEISAALDKSKYVIRHFVTQKIQLKYSPEIRFHFDHGFDNANSVEQLLHNVIPASVRDQLHIKK